MIYNTKDMKYILPKLPKDIFLTSDTWFGRQNILQIANRPFNDINEMNLFMLKKWNKTVKKNDVVFHLGNFAWDPITAENVLSKLNGKIYFILGDNDDALIDVADKFEKVFVIDSGIVKLDKFDCVLCHYPMKNWCGKESGTIHFHGHEVYNNDTQLIKGSNVVNVCTDFWDFTPVKISNIYDIIKYTNNQ